MLKKFFNKLKYIEELEDELDNRSCEIYELQHKMEFHRENYYSELKDNAELRGIISKLEKELSSKNIEVILRIKD